MESFTFFTFLVVFGTLSFPLFILSLILIRKKKATKTLLISGLTLICIPVTILIGVKVNDKIDSYYFQGEYEGKICNSNVEISIDSKEFFITISGNSNEELKGVWHYSNDFDAYFFTLPNNKINVHKEYDGTLIIQTDLYINNCKLNDFTVLKK
ncbi:hypothetical protein OAH12_02390 [Cyclobacteriaceae bacterium]|nr:hypothetical protein [Cyclobacteriaceae bacterium]